MANHVYQAYTITGAKEVITRLKETVFNEQFVGRELGPKWTEVNHLVVSEDGTTIDVCLTSAWTSITPYLEELVEEHGVLVSGNFCDEFYNFVAVVYNESNRLQIVEFAPDPDEIENWDTLNEYLVYEFTGCDVPEHLMEDIELVLEDWWDSLEKGS